MTGNGPEENPVDNQPSTGQSVSAETDAQEQAGALADVVAVQERPIKERLLEKLDEIETRLARLEQRDQKALSD